MGNSRYISEEEAWKFIEENLQIDEPKLAMERDRLQFLNSVIERYHNKIPFHNLEIVSKPQSDRTVPSLQANVDNVLRGFGGLCWTSNSAMLCILQAIDYDVNMIFTSITKPDNHVSLIVNNVRYHGDAYLVEFSMGEPSFHAISLDFETETDVVHESFRSYKLVKEGDVYTRLVRTRIPRRPRENPWKVQYTFKAKPCHLDTAAKAMRDNIYQNNKSTFSQGLRLVRFVNNKLICIKDNLLLIENTRYQLGSTVLETDEDILTTMMFHFPETPVDMARNAINLWRPRCGKGRKDVPDKDVHVLQY